MRPVNVIVLHWNDSTALEGCLAGLAAMNEPGVRVIVVENGSSMRHRNRAEEVVSAFRRVDHELYCVASETNRGYAGGNNLGIRYCIEEQLDGDICILNPDVRLSGAALHAMRQALQDGAGLAMCRAVDENHRVLYDTVTLRGFRQRFATAELAVVDTDYAQGACLLIRREIAEQAQFDERFFLYWEEVDLSLRVRAMGYRVVSVTTASIVRRANSLGRLPTALYYSARNAVLMRKKYPGQFSWASYALYLLRLSFVSLKLYANPLLLARGLRSVAAGAFDGMRNRFGPRGEPTLAPQAGHSHTSPLEIV